jgi:tetratricopeptide (TPR) repeat protein
LDGTVLGPTPLSAFIPNGQRLSVELPGYAPITERLPEVSSRILERRYELSKLTPATPPIPESTAATTKPASVTAIELLERAQQARGQGKYSLCASLYRQLLAAHPNSNEARVSMVSLGELELQKLGHPALALRAFDQYLTAGGSLVREARYGRIEALERLGRDAEARTQALAFVRDYPKSIQADTLRRKFDAP